jgi:hypothetical protein
MSLMVNIDSGINYTKVLLQELEHSLQLMDIITSYLGVYYGR